MARVTKILFGSFGERLSVPVIAGDWWLFLASGVELETESHISLSLADCLPESSARRFRAVPGVVDAQWFRSVSPVGLQLPRGLAIESPLRIGAIAARVQDDSARGGDMIELAYPFILVDEEGQLLLQFSSNGPAAEIRRELGVAFGERLLWNELPLNGPSHAQ